MWTGCSRFLRRWTCGEAGPGHGRAAGVHGGAAARA
jgi:hypothetical protein